MKHRTWQVALLLILAVVLLPGAACGRRETLLQHRHRRHRRRLVPPGRSHGRGHREERAQHGRHLRGHHRRHRQPQAPGGGQGGDGLRLRLPRGLGQRREDDEGAGQEAARARRAQLLRAAAAHRDQGGDRHQVRHGPQGRSGCRSGAPNSGTEEQADYVLKALGIDWNKDFTREKLGASESVAALKDGKIDAFFWSGAVPTSSIIDLSSTPGLKMVLLPVGGEVADKIMKANPAVFHKTVFAKGGYSALDKDVEAIAITAVRERHGELPGGQDVPDRERDLRQHHGDLRRVEGRHEADAREIHRPDDPGGDQVPAPRRREVLQGEGRAEVDRVTSRGTPVRACGRTPRRIRQDLHPALARHLCHG